MAFPSLSTEQSMVNHLSISFKYLACTKIHCFYLKMLGSTFQHSVWPLYRRNKMCGCWKLEGKDSKPWVMGRGCTGAKGKQSQFSARQNERFGFLMKKVKKERKGKHETIQWVSATEVYVLKGLKDKRLFMKQGC